ncbi:MAG: hypothetical protein BGO53_01090 [Sphingobacteriales bacterium 39-19]|nr:tetratricopeptide repeat protein [Sphingobacteriales bacterium]OJW08965.1 MAG: hypothetical protein BGO53_01090 [Sphingobacteriales bacterium 39-19]
MLKRFTITVFISLRLMVAMAQVPATAYSPMPGNADAAMIIAKKELKQAGLNKDEPAKAKAYTGMALAYTYKGQTDSALLFYIKAKNIYLENKNEAASAYTDIALAKVFIGQFKIDSALTYLLRADSLSTVTGNISMQADVNWMKGLVFKNKQDYSTAAGYFKKAMAAFYQQNNFSKYISAGCNLSMAYRLMDQNDSSLRILAQCLSVFNKQSPPDSLLYANIRENYADTYLEMGNYAMALHYFTEALAQFKKQKSTVDIIYQKYSIGRTLTGMNRFKEAESYLLDAYTLCDSLKNHKYLVWISNVLQEMYSKKGDWKNAYFYVQKKADWNDSIGIINQIEKVNSLNRKFENANKEKEISLLKSKNQMILWIFIAGILALLLTSLLIWIYDTQRKIREQKTLNYFATSLYNQNTVDDVFWDIAKNCISQLNFEDCVIYSLDESRNMLIQKAAFGPKNPDGFIITNVLEIPVGKGIVGSVAKSFKPEIIKDTRNDNRYLVDDISRKSEIAVPIIVDGKLIGVIDSEHSRAGFFTKRHLDILQKIADTCAKKLTRNFVEEGLRKKIARDLHDDIGSTLSSINIISKVALQQSNIQEHLKNQLTSIKDYSLHIMESMGDMVWAINPDNDSIESLISKMKEWAAEICEPREVQLYFESSAGIENIKLDTEKRKHFFLIFKEAINNAIKYSQCKNIHVHMNKTAAAIIRMSIMDDGIGFNMQDHKKGNGLLNMQARAQQLQAEMNITSAAGKGTHVELTSKII